MCIIIRKAANYVKLNILFSDTLSSSRSKKFKKKLDKKCKKSEDMKISTKVYFPWYNLEKTQIKKDIDKLNYIWMKNNLITERHNIW